MLFTVTLFVFFRKLRAVIQVVAKGIVISFGVWWKIKGKQSNRSESVALTCASHSCFFDALTLVFADDIPYAVSKSANRNIPLLGSTLVLFFVILGLNPGYIIKC